MNCKHWPYWVGGAVGIVMSVPFAYLKGKQECGYVSDYPANLACGELMTALLHEAETLALGLVMGVVVALLYVKSKNRKQSVI